MKLRSKRKVEDLEDELDTGHAIFEIHVKRIHKLNKLVEDIEKIAAEPLDYNILTLNIL